MIISGGQILTGMVGSAGNRENPTTGYDHPPGAGIIVLGIVTHFKRETK
jgi:hypothetical protein